MLCYFLKGKPIDEVDISMNRLIELTEGYTGAEIEYIVNEASRDVAMEA